MYMIDITYIVVDSAKKTVCVVTAHMYMRFERSRSFKVIHF